VTASPTGRRWAISTPPTRAPRSSSTRPTHLRRKSFDDGAARHHRRLGG
jgi:hypothetical protein